MDKVIVTVLLIIGGITASLTVFNGLYPAIASSNSAVSSASSRLSERIESRVKIIEVSSNSTQVYVWVKNVGTVSVKGVGQSDIFFGKQNDFGRVTYGGVTAPYWDYAIESSGTEWSQAETIKITINLASPPSAGTYLAKVVLPNGIYDEITFGVP